MRARVRVGALGPQEFAPGLYVYVGSALGGIEQRIARHTSRKKKMHWHIDFLLSKGQLLSTIAVPAERKQVECAVVRALAQIEGVTAPVPRFGSSDCGCHSHLLYFGDMDPEWVAENVAMRIAMLDSIYPSECA